MRDMTIQAGIRKTILIGTLRRSEGKKCSILAIQLGRRLAEWVRLCGSVAARLVHMGERSCRSMYTAIWNLEEADVYMNRMECLCTY